MRIRVLSGPLMACLLLAAGCGGGGGGTSATPSTAQQGFPYTVHNCGVTTTYRRPPARAVTMNQHTTEIMLALGLRESMVGTAYMDDAILPEYASAYGSVKVLAEHYPSQEVLLSAEPDFVYGGFSSAFDQSKGLGRDALAKDGINTYLNVENCAAGPVTTATDDEEITTIGRIFGVPARAKALTARMDATVAAVRARLAGVRPVKVSVYDSGTRSAFTAGGAGIGNNMIEQAGGVNVFADLNKSFGDVSFEQVAQRAPDVIVIYDYGDTTLASKKAFLLSNPALKDVPAVKNKRLVVLPLTSTVLGVRVPAAIQTLAQGLHPEAFR
ncbi:ABC transporter substrate-binding protein [Actinoallomurus acaciae]|uniref:ABC transporter substrate-binding protein n=1 Tax=Actinoallomurus acaciae TaxID=502577 RepID=A0ABV5YD21_9ACTN